MKAIFKIPKEIKPRKAKRKCSYKESKMQQACVAWYRLQYAQYARYLFAVPNGGFRNAREGEILKREGVLSGVPDLVLALPRKNAHGLFIEMKIKGNTTSDEQNEMIELLRAEGYRVEVCWTLEEFMNLINEYLN